MAVTQNTYTGNGSTTNYSFTFPYLEPTDVKVLLNGVLTTAYTFANATTIQFNTAPANGVIIDILRSTDDSSLQATFYPGSAIRSVDLNDNFTQNLYVTQEANREAALAVTTANSAVTTSNSATAAANTAVSTANAATATANTAASNASAAVSTANTANSNASAAVSTANTASTNATTAVTTANIAADDASAALTIANVALTTANTASSNASAAVTTANTASTNASSAVSTANTASGNASTAVTTANSATTTANTALSTANTAITTANAAASAVANAILYDTVANVAAIPASPANNDAIEIVNSTGIESFTPASGVPAGFTGDAGLSVRMVYTTSGSTWNWIQYFPNDPDDRYGNSITDLQSDVTAIQGNVSTLQSNLGTAQSDILGLDSSKLDSTTAASTYQTQAGMSAYLTNATATSTYAPLHSPTFTGNVVIPAGASISGYLTVSDAAATYQSQAAMNTYLTASAASSAFASKGAAIAFSIALG